jgi:hypothetical protein
MKIKMLQVVTPEIMDYAQYAIKINKAYCNQHKYEYVLYKNIDTNRHPAWSKLKGAIEIINTCDLLFILDADAYVQNQSIKIEKFANNECPIQICCNGAMIIKMGEITDLLLQYWWEAGKNHKKALGQFWEQDILNSLHNSGKDVPVHKIFRENIFVHKMRDFNSHWLDMEERYLDPNQFVHHVMARPAKDKARLIKNYYKKLIQQAATQKPKTEHLMNFSRNIDRD